MKFSTLFITAALVLSSVPTASALTRPNENISVGSTQSASTPIPMQFFCARFASECRASRITSTAFSDELSTMLQRVNAHVNKTIRPMPRPPAGWTVNPVAGDCNDYALTKRSMLIGMGIPAGALRIGITKTWRGESHAVLIVKTDAGDIVLDNLSARVKTLRETGYRISMLSSANPRKWIRG